MISPSLAIAPASEIAAERPTRAELLELISAAARAPSGDNMQPWQFVANSNETLIEIFIDADRDSSPMNSGQRMSLIACGAAIQNALLVARERGWHAELELPDELMNVSHALLVARIRLGARTAQNPTENYSRLISERVANRRPYDGRPLSPIILVDLELSTPELNGVVTHWIDDRSTLNELARIVGRGDAIMFGEASMRAAFLANVRFDLPAKAQADEGLSLASLETSAPLGIALRAMKRIPNALFELTGGRATFAAHAQKLVRSASGLCVVTVDEHQSYPEIQVGRTMQRAWLALTGLGFSAQPMMSLLVLDNALRHGTPELIARLKRQRTEALLSDFRSLLRAAGIEGRAGFLLRFGHAAPPSGRTGRLGAHFA